MPPFGNKLSEKGSKVSEARAGIEKGLIIKTQAGRCEAGFAQRIRRARIVD